jgi:hypothetical protein
LPQGPKADAAQRQIEKAEVALKSSEAELAQTLGYRLCQCTWPPQIMLWREQEKLYRCQNPQCGKVSDPLTEDRKKLLAQARSFVTKTVRENPDYDYFQKTLESDELFLTLRPYLSTNFKHAIISGRFLVGPLRGSNMPGIASSFLRETDRLEKEWNATP